jgi:hypothetical protein
MPDNSNSENYAGPRKCKSCGCTEDRGCVITVAIAFADGTSRAVIQRGCSWSRDYPENCTACLAAYSDNQNETDILMDLFPVEFGRAREISIKSARDSAARSGH